MKTPYKMKGMDFGNSPVTKKAGPETNRSVGTDSASQDFEDREQAIENAINDYDVQKPSKSQIAKALKKVKAERKAGY
jgi:hypothetical protein|tara:strand:+ start:678 stop:911 length:234 start_codon:yes stop_codon:yes gene_type:complete